MEDGEMVLEKSTIWEFLIFLLFEICALRKTRKKKKEVKNVESDESHRDVEFCSCLRL
jgi:hypothetical protein